MTAVYLLITNDHNVGLRGALFATEAQALSTLRETYAVGSDVSDDDLIAHIESQGIQCSLTTEPVPSSGPDPQS